MLEIVEDEGFTLVSLRDNSSGQVLYLSVDSFSFREAFVLLDELWESHRDLEFVGIWVHPGILLRLNIVTSILEIRGGV